jgi:hypothetical protein
MTRKFLVLAVGLCAMASATAQEESFFTDPSVLETWEKGTFDLGWVRPDIAEWAPKYDSVMVDQPEVFVSDDSKYKGAKADHLKTLSDAARLAVIERLEAGGYAIVEEPAPNVVYIRWALHDIYLKKKKRGILSYTPLGMVVHATAQAAVRDVWKKIDINELGLKIEWIDSSTGELLSAGTANRGLRKSKGQKAQLVRWEELYALFYTIGEQTRCHMDADVKPEAADIDCDAIVIEPDFEEG